MESLLESVTRDFNVGQADYLSGNYEAAYKRFQSALNTLAGADLSRHYFAINGKRVGADELKNIITQWRNLSNS